MLRGTALTLALACFPLTGRATEDSRDLAEEQRVFARLQSDPCVVVKDEAAGSGVTGAHKFTLRFTDGEEIDVKWKPAPSGLDGWNNSPRKEVAAYEVQRLFLDPPDYVVPIAVMRCFPPAAFANVERKTIRNVKGASCELGEMGLWVHDVHFPNKIYDPELFESDPIYARSIADMNLLTYLIEHEDGRVGNFAMSDDPANRRVYSIDNGIAFGAFIHNFFVQNWNELRVPALRAASVDRLRAVPPEGFDAFAVVVEMRRDADGVLRPVAKTPRQEPDDGVHLGDGMLQMGLSRDEIEEMKERRQELLDDVSAGKIKTF